MGRLVVMFLAALEFVVIACPSVAETGMKELSWRPASQSDPDALSSGHRYH